MVEVSLNCEVYWWCSYDVWWVVAAKPHL